MLFFQARHWKDLKIQHLQELLYAELVGDLGAAEHHGVGTLGVIDGAAQGLDLLEDQEAGGRGKELGDVVDGGLLTVHNAEAVGDEDVGQGGELGGEGLTLGVVLGGLGGVEAHVLQQDDIAGLQGGEIGRAHV